MQNTILLKHEFYYLKIRFDIEEKIWTLFEIYD